METTNKSFLELITDYTINIPIIQRDYAQGRDEEKVKRDRFLKVIFKHLKEDIPLNLDFVYGRITDKTFYPIDGQQRLTTLFLLHWYISIKENIDNSSKENLIKFVYDTRISSREFCKALVEERIAIPIEAKEDNFIIEIQNNHWFRDAWKRDPTIKSMLTMIQAIHERYKIEQSENFWDKLMNCKIISFQILDLGAKGFELTDELYIKMNARGKQLTTFESFKANFIQFIDKTFKNNKLKHPIKGEISYSEYFAYKIEKEWMDLFWAFRDKKTVIDEMFMNYFGYIAQMCYFKSNKNAKAEDFENNFEQYEVIFKDEVNLLFLFKSLDKLYDIASNNGVMNKDKSQDFFELLLQKGRISDNYDGQIRLFWNLNDEVNLFEKCINEGLNYDVRNKIIFYCVIHYLLKFNLKEVNEGLKNYIRVIRNLLQATRQRNETKFNTNVRINNFDSYWILFEQLETAIVYQTLQQQINNKGSQISEQSLNNEIVKAKLLINNEKNSLFSIEEFSYFGGLIHQLKPQDNIDKFTHYATAVREIWNKKITDSLKIQALVACGFHGTYIKNCRMGEMWHFGNSENWTTILTNDIEDISKNIILLLNTYLIQPGNSTEERLKSIVDKWLDTNKGDRSWRYYFLKYPDFTSKLNYYAWPNDCDYEMRMLGSEGSNPLLAYHISPYVLTICSLIKNEDICEGRYCFQQYSGHSPLNLKNGMSLTCTEDGWLIENKTILLSAEIIVDFYLEKIDDKYLLKEFDSRDRVLIAVDFINMLYRNTALNNVIEPQV